MAGIVLPNGMTPDGERSILSGQPQVVDIGQVMAQVAADVCAKILNEGFQPSFDEAIEPYKNRIEALEREVEELKAQLKYDTPEEWESTK